ncbi:MAG: prepilin-type N-terminal cleavage/methylation domain-containing protein [Acidobacteria bacterium]|nr:prepilin-type N-terminal cleavage/methylation domain-containing protein [Acidobacteriota bacterium]
MKFKIIVRGPRAEEPSGDPGRASRGYSLIELLVVIAIIGLVSLVTVPNFMSMYQSSRLKSSVRQFATDLRGARQTAVTQYRWVKIDIDEDSVPTQYTISVSEDLGTTWGTPQERVLLDPISVASMVNIADGDDDDEWPEIIFRNDGTIVTTGDGLSPGIVFKTTSDVAKPQISVQVSPAGSVSSK